MTDPFIETWKKALEQLRDHVSRFPSHYRDPRDRQRAFDALLAQYRKEEAEGPAPYRHRSSPEGMDA